MDGGGDGTPVKEVAWLAFQTVLRDEGAVGLPAQKRVDGGMVVPVEVDGKGTSVSGQREGFKGSKQLSELLRYEPW